MTIEKEQINHYERFLARLDDLVESGSKVVSLNWTIDCAPNPFGAPIPLGGTVTLRFVSPMPFADKTDPNAWGRFSSNDHLNPFEEAVDEIERLRAALEGER